MNSNNNPYFIEIRPNTFVDFLKALRFYRKVFKDFAVLYRGQSDANWKLNSKLARPLVEIPQPFRRIIAFDQMRGYFEKTRPSAELIELEKKGIDSIYVLGKHLQQNPTTKKIKGKLDNKEILTPFMDFTNNPFVALFFANYKLKSIEELTFNSILERNTDGAVFVIHINKKWIRKNFQEVVELIELILKEKYSPHPIFWSPSVDLNDLDDQKAKRQQAEYIFHSSLDLSLEAFVSNDFRINKIILKKDWFNEVYYFLVEKEYTINYLFPGHVLIDSF